MSIDGQRIKWCRNIAENFNRQGRAHERYRQTTDGQTTTYQAYSERELTFANKKLRYREKHSASVVLSWCTL